jgi:hypothetical protein
MHDNEAFHMTDYAWRADLSADPVGHLTGPVPTPYIVSYMLYHTAICVLIYHWCHSIDFYILHNNTALGRMSVAL